MPPGVRIDLSAGGGCDKGNSKKYLEGSDLMFMSSCMMFLVFAILLSLYELCVLQRFCFIFSVFYYNSVSFISN